MLNIEWTNRDTLSCNNMTCANCQYNDGVVYTSLPPQYKCTITNEFHHNNDKCDVEFAPIKHGHWVSVMGWISCSVCDREPPNETNYESDYCPNCGAKMNEMGE